MAIRKKLSGLDSILGEPKKEKKEAVIQDETRATFQLNTDVLEKIRAIAYWERTLQKDIINTAMSEYIAKYEKKNGAIKPMP